MKKPKVITYINEDGWTVTALADIPEEERKKYDKEVRDIEKAHERYMRVSEEEKTAHKKKYVNLFKKMQSGF